MKKVFLNFLLVISALFASIMYYSESKVLYMIVAFIILSAVCMLVFNRCLIEYKAEKKYQSFFAIVLAGSIDLSSIYTALKYRDIAKVNRIIETIPHFKDYEVGRIMVICFVGMIALYYYYYISSVFVGFLFRSLQTRGFEVDYRNLITNIKTNGIIPLSTLAFFLIPGRLSIGSIFGALFAFLISIFLCGQKQDILRKTIHENSKGVLIISIASALGVIINAILVFVESSVVNKISDRGIPYEIIVVFSIIMGISGFISVFVSLCWFYKRFLALFDKRDFFRIPKYEILTYSLLIAISIICVAWIFANSNAFYNDTIDYDLIYTSDSPELVRYNVYLSVGHSENDLRQPLFALFAAPFMGIPYLFSKFCTLFINRWLSEALFEATCQIIILFASYFLLARCLNLSGIKRMCFILVLYCTYTTFLFSIMLEQYVICFFWLMFCINQYINNGKTSSFALMATSGTLSTNAVLIPFIKDKYGLRDLKKRIADTLDEGMLFVFIMLAVGKFDLFFNLTWKLSEYMNYSGSKLGLEQKVKMYTHFISGCFVAQKAGVDTLTNAYPSWQLLTVSNFSFLGIIILLASIIGLVISRKDLISKISIGWIAFSIAMLVILGWGTAENGLVLYSLYFFWPFVVGITKLFDLINKRIKYAIIPLSVLVIFALLLCNKEGICNIIDFAIKYYTTA